MIGPKAIIHLDNLVHNYRQIKKRVGDVPIMAVAKANGYGHGAVPIAKTLQDEGVEFFAVFTMEEAQELRANRIDSNILIFSRLNAEFAEAANDLDVTLILSQKDDIEILIDLYNRTGKKPKIHLKIDTGMTRLGIAYKDARSVLELIKNSQEINCEGIYSHFATADEGDPSYAKWQLKQFNNVLNIVEELELDIKYRHFSNSGAILNLPESNFDLVRVGMLLYGAFPSDEVPQILDLKPVMQYIAPIVTVRQVEKDVYVSYGGKYKTDRRTHIGVVQCGFADGLSRPWHENGYVMYNKQKYKIAGRICMDQMSVDFGDTVPNIGDEVLLMGQNDHGAILAEEISQTISTTPYVLFTAIGGRTERIFVKE